MADFYTLLTVQGRAGIASALALNTTVQWTEIAVGDGGGKPVAPDENQTRLVHEHYRARINQLTVDASNPHHIVAEAIIPTLVGGWTIEEVGIFDVTGSLVAIANFPSTYKPTLEEGSGRDLVIRLIVEVTNASTVTLKVDPAVVLASQQWCVTQLEGRSLQKSLNLGDIGNASQALANIGGVDAAYVDKTLLMGRSDSKHKIIAPRLGEEYTNVCEFTPPCDGMLTAFASANFNSTGTAHGTQQLLFDDVIKVQDTTETTMTHHGTCPAYDGCRIRITQKFIPKKTGGSIGFNLTYIFFPGEKG